MSPDRTEPQGGRISLESADLADSSTASARTPSPPAGTPSTSMRRPAWSPPPIIRHPWVCADCKARYATEAEVVEHERLHRPTRLTPQEI